MFVIPDHGTAETRIKQKFQYIMFNTIQWEKDQYVKRTLHHTNLVQHAVCF